MLFLYIVYSLLLFYIIVYFCGSPTMEMFNMKSRVIHMCQLSSSESHGTQQFEFCFLSRVFHASQQEFMTPLSYINIKQMFRLPEYLMMPKKCCPHVNDSSVKKTHNKIPDQEKSCIPCLFMVLVPFKESKTSTKLIVLVQPSLCFCSSVCFNPSDSELCSTR